MQSMMTFAWGVCGRSLPDLSERGRAPVQHVFPRPLRKTAVESVLTACKVSPFFSHFFSQRRCERRIREQPAEELAVAARAALAAS